MNQKEKKFIREFEKNIEKTIKKYNLFDKKEKVLVACSGGKDSTTVLYVLKKLKYNLEAITVDALIGKYTKENLENLREFCKKNKIKLHIISFRDEFGYSLCYLKSMLKSKGHNLNSCTICGVLRRYLINKYAKKHNAKKLVTGHNLDDEAQAILMNFFRSYNEANARLGPLTGLIKSKGFIQRVKPLYFCSEEDIEKYSKIMNFPVVYGRCPCSADAYRERIRTTLNELEKTNKKVKENIIHYFLKALPKIKKYYYTEEELETCSKCGEPAKKDICRTCQIVELLKR